jgi:DNA-directed RNA polymerase subunit M/transcription elongation factor TFIIS
MILYGCPRCESRLESPPDKAGLVIACPKCKQKVKVPGPSLDEPLPGKIIEPTRSDQPRNRPEETARVKKCQVCGTLNAVPRDPAFNWIECRECGRTIALSPVMEPDTESASSDNSHTQSGSREKRLHEKHCVECGSIILAKAMMCPKCGVRQHVEYERDYQLRPSRNGIAIPLLISAIGNIIAALVWVSTCFLAFLAVPIIILSIFEFILWSKSDSMPLSSLSSSAKSLAIFEIVVGLISLPAFVCGIIIMINSSKLAALGIQED